ncbi:MAG TPA: endo-1,4-beta-xylanase [Bacteroidota bacterium]|nr:endo-1,4-beta-xylanase [Bacteroidota bacterium]
MMNRTFLLSFVVCALLAVTVYGQNTTDTVQLKSLKEVYAGKFLIGAAGDLKGYSDAELANIKTQYDILTPENCMKPQPIHPSENTYNFTTPDSMVDWCQRNGVKVWGHTLLWHGQTGRWFFLAPDSQPATRELAMERLKKHIFTVVGRYKGRVIGWDVVNEAIADSGAGGTENLRKFSWYKTIGPDVLTMAFKWAHEADPNAKLLYNDYNIEQGAIENKGKHASAMMLLKRLIAEGAPITGVGIQGHWYLEVNLADVEKAIVDFASLGLKVSITELDVTATGSNSGAFGVRGGDKTIPKQNYVKQAEVYAELFKIFKRHSDVIDRVTFWGISDRRSWRWGQDALLFDRQLQPKASFNAVIDIGSK